MQTLIRLQWLLLVTSPSPVQGMSFKQAKYGTCTVTCTHENDLFKETKHGKNMRPTRRSNRNSRLYIEMKKKVEDIRTDGQADSLIAMQGRI